MNFYSSISIFIAPRNEKRGVGASLLLTSSIAGLVVIFVLSSSLNAAPRSAPFTKKDTINVFPSIATSDSWNFDEQLLFADVNEDGLYQQFNVMNSASLKRGNIEDAPNSDLDTREIDSETPEEQISDEQQTTSAPESIEENNASEAQIDESNSIQVEEPQSSDEEDGVSEPVTFNDLRRGVFGLFSKVSVHYPLAQESVTDNLDGAGGMSSESISTNDVSASDEQIPKQAEIEEPIENANNQIENTASTNGSTQNSEEDTSANEPEATPTSESQQDSASETIDTHVAPQEVASKNQPTSSSENVLEFNDFSIPPLGSGQFITNVQLRLSFAGQIDETITESLPVLDIEYSLGASWESAGSILIDDEVSNALNGGYFLFALPTMKHAYEFADLKVRAVLRGDVRMLTGAYIDALWLEVDTETFDRELLKERLRSEWFTFLTAPKFSTLLSERLDFSRDERPLFTLRYESQRNIAVRLIRDLFGRPLAQVEKVVAEHKSLGPLDVHPTVDITRDGLITIQFTDSDREKMRPGEYALSVTYDEGGKRYTDAFNFQWGLLAVNPDQTEYELGTDSHIAFGALTQNGNTLCDANLVAYVIAPDEFITRLDVTPSGLCVGNNVVDVPDYSAFFTPTTTGMHEIYLERLDDNGNLLSHTSDTFNVVKEHPITISRRGPTRIYPPSPYPMSFTLTAHDAVQGTLTERIPKGFIVEAPNADVLSGETRNELTWKFDLRAGESITFSYTFDAPDLSPYLYTLGPARIESEETFDIASSEGMVLSDAEALGTTTSARVPISATYEFIEHRAWQIASDATGNMILLWDDNAAIPAGWTCISCAPGDPFYQRFVVGSSTYNSTGGSLTHTHNASTSLNVSSLGTTENISGATIAGVSHTHSLTPTIDAASNLPSYRQLRFIQYTTSAGDPPSLPEGAIALFDVASSSLPVNWSRYALQDGYHIRGENTAASTGGSNIHTHTISGTAGAASGGTVGSRGPDSADGATNDHTHTISTSTPVVNNEPPYREVLLAKLGTTTATIPNSLIAMWTDSVPTAWASVSSDAGDAFSNMFLKANATYGATGGANSHTNATISNIMTSGPSAIETNARSGVSGAGDTHTHLVTMSNFTTESHVPPYTTVIIGKRLGNVPIYNQFSYRWYANGISSSTPTDPWPLGAVNLNENEMISATSTPVKNGQVLRLRISARITNATSTAGSTFKLQYAAGTACSALSNWSDVGSATSSALWRGYNNTGVSDHLTLATSTLASTTVRQTYEENGYTAGTPNEISPTGIGEWDFVLMHNGAASSTQYCFRLVQSDGSAFSAYTSYPQLLTNRAPQSPTLSKLFDNEKTPTTTPRFEFVSSDPESDDITYQIQIDDDHAFTSPVMDRNSASHGTQFENLLVPSDKDPYNSGQLVRFIPNVALTNGATYYWRVRGQDPSGSGMWGNWSTIRSLTIDTSLTASAWFQTTEEQFDTNALTGIDALASDQVTLITGSTTGTMISTPIDFDDGTSGTAWDYLAFTDVKTGGTLTYSIQYFTPGGSWALIPESVLPGNASGFNASPVSLLDLDTDAYNRLRIIASFTKITSSPSMQDWTVAWGYRVQTPTITKLFPNEKVGTTTPTFEFKTTDPQSDPLTYQIQWSIDHTFTSSTTRTSDTHSGFINANDGIDTSPFTSGDTVRFTIQGSDALSNNTTYWWRVRAKDPTGDDAYSFWTEPRSFTVDATVAVSTWFQTTEEQFDTNILSGTDALIADTVSVATTAREAMVVFGEGIETYPRYRMWNGADWSAEGSLLDIGAVLKWAVVKESPKREEYIAVTVGTDGDVNAQVYALGTWGNLQEMTISMGDVNSRGFDMTYETLSGDGMVAFCDGDADPSYYLWNGSGWSSGGTINLASANNCEWIKLASDPVSDEIIILAGDALGSQFEAQVWNGSAWGNSVTLGSIIDQDHEGLAVAYEESGDQAIIAVSDGNPARFRYATWNGTTWSGAATVSLGNDFEWGTLVPNIGSDALALCYQDEDSDIGVVEWSGSAWGTFTELTVDGNAKNDPGFACVYENSGSRDNYIMTTYSTTTGVGYSSWNNAAWSTGVSLNSIGDSATMQLERTGGNLILGLFFDDGIDSLLFSSWNGTSWSTTTALEENVSVDTSPFGRPYTLAPRGPGRSGTTVVSPAIIFSEGTGPYWDSFLWTDSTPGTSDILYSMQYYDATTNSWKFIPDAEIPGNSIGTSTGPIDLSGLNVNTYARIRPYATLTCDENNNCPTLSDWTVTWAEGITVSGTLHQYDQSASTTSGVVNVAVDGVLQVGKTGSVSNGVWSIGNVTAFPGDIITVFVNEANDANEAVGVTRYDGFGDVTGMRLFERHLALGSNDATSTPLTNADIGYYDHTNEEDLFFDVSGTVFNLCADSGCGDAELYVGQYTNYAPGGTVVTHDFENNGTVNVGGNTIFVSGSWDNNATTSMATSTVVFTATSTTESIDETGATNPSFYNITFGTTTGSGTWSLVTPLDVNNDLTVNRGTLDRGSRSISIAGSLMNGANGYWSGVGTTTFDGSGSKTWSDSNATLQNVGKVVIDGSSKIITLAGNVKAHELTIGADDAFDVSGSSYAITVLGNWSNYGTFASQNGTVFFAATTTNKVILTGGQAFSTINFNGGGGSWSFAEQNVSITNDIIIATGTVNLPTGTTTIAGSFTNTGGTFAHNNGTVYFTTSGTKTISLLGTTFTNAFYNVRFTGIGSWSFTEAHATTSNNLVITQGTVSLPSGTLTVGGNFMNTGGGFNHNFGTIRFTGAGTYSIDTNASFYSLAMSGNGSWSFIDANITLLGDLTTQGGTTTLPSATTTIGGSIINFAQLAHNNGNILLNSIDTGEILNLGASSLNNVTVNSGTGGWTITASATTTGNFRLATSSLFTVASNQTLAVGGAFINAVGGASTTWTGSTLSLLAGSYSINSKTTGADTYGTLLIASGAHIAMWNSSAATTITNGNSSLYSQDHGAVDGDLYIYGNYVRTSGTEYWSYGTDFDGTILGTTTSRQVNVRFGSDGSASLTNSALIIVGTTTSTSTVATQGGGTYTVTVRNGTTTASHYSFSDLGATGLSLLGSTKVTSLSDGNITPAVALGTGMTVSSSTIDLNQGLQIYRVNFSTTSPIAAYNVSQTDGAPASYWWFRESSGNLDGESFDNDTGDPGSIRWDDSSLSITIAGTVYADDESTPLGGPTCGTGNPVQVVVEEGGIYDGACDGSGNFSIPGVVIVGDPTITVFLNGATGGERAVTVTKTPTADILDLDLIVNRTIVRHEDVVPMTIADMASFDNTDDNDIPFTAATGTTNSLVTAPNSELHIWATSTFTPGGTVTLEGGGTGESYDGSLHLGQSASFIGAGTTTYSIGGSFTQEVGAAFNPASSIVLMTATTSGKTVTAATGETVTMNELRFVGSGGSWNMNGNIQMSQNIHVATGTVTGTGNVTITNGSFYGDGLVSLGAGTTTIGQSNTLGGVQGWTFANLVLGDGVVNGTTTPGSNATTTILGKLTIATGHYLNALGTVWDLQGTGNVFVENGTFIEATSTVRYSGTSGSNVLSTNYHHLVLGAIGGTPTYTATGLGIVVHGNLTVGGVAASSFNLDMNDTALDVDGNVMITPLGTLIASGSGVFTVGGSWNNVGTFNGSNGLVTFNGNAAHTIAAGNSSFSSLSMNAAGEYTITQNATSTGIFTLTAANDFILQNGVTLAVGGSFINQLGGADTVWSGSRLHFYGGGNYSINASTTADQYGNLTIGPNTQIRMWNSSASTTELASTASLYSMDHANVNGDLYVFGNYVKTNGTDYWSHALDFDGTSLQGGERQVDVYFASGTTAFYAGGGLHVLGSPSASTTLQNQGAGTYGLRVGGTASTTFSYYEVAHMNASGLVFSGTPNVSTLSYGTFTVSLSGGSAMTVGGTVMDQNPARTFTNNSFGTTTGVTGYNVTATGTTVSSWRFTNHNGSIDGEGFDIDPDGDPGYVVWDDSAAQITISGRVYSDEGTTVSGVCDGTTPNVHLRMAGLTSYTTTCNAGTGAYSISGITYSPGDSFVIYIDGEAEKAATVSEDPISNINNFDLYENRVITRHEGADPLSIFDMSVWDSSDDADIPFTAVDGSPDTLTLPANRKLIIWSSKELQPNGNVTVSGGGGGAGYDGTLELYENAIFNATGGETHTISGSLLSGNGASIDDETSTFIFTTSGALRTIDTNEFPLHNLTLNGSGSWTITNAALEVGNDMTLIQGTLTLPTGTSTVGGSFSNTGGTFLQNGGHVRFTSAAPETIRQNGSSFGTTTFAGSGSWTYLDIHATSTGDVIIVSGTVTAPSGSLAVHGDFVNRGTFTHNSGTIRMTSGAASTTVTASGSDLGSIAFVGGADYHFTDTDVALAGTLRILNGAVTLATGTTAIGGSFLNVGGSFTHASGTILFNSSDIGESINPGGSSFNIVSIAAPTGGYSIVGSATTTGNFSLTSASSFTLSPGTTLSVGNVFTNLVGGANTTWTGSTLYLSGGVPYVINTKLTGGDTYNDIILTNNTDVRMWNSSGTTTIGDGFSSLYSMDHANVNGELNIYGNYERSTGGDYWSYATDFDGASLSGSERVVNVRIANGATTTFSGGTLEVVGGAGATTTIRNQGSGTYGFIVSGGTINLQRYAVRDVGLNGLVLSGLTTITSIALGDFELGVNGGTLITLSSTTLNYNASMVITGMRFATTSPITGTNITVTGSTPSAWTFTNHRGNLDGEYFDVDGITDCGSVRWDDSTCLLTQQSAYRWRNDDGGEGVPDNEWFDTNWSKRKRVTVTNEDATEYQNAVIELTIPYDNDMQADFDDLRFTNAGGTTTLSYVRETYTPSSEAIVWVKIPILAANGNTTIYMYYGNGAAVSGSHGTSTFSVYDDFEDGSISEYSGDTGLFTTSGAFAYQGSYGLEAVDPNDRTTDGIYRTGVTVSQGETIRFFQYIDTTAGGSDETCTLFGVQSPGSNNNNYAVCLEQYGVDRVSISKNVYDNDSNGIILATTTISYNTGWYEVEVDWHTDDSIDVSVYMDDVLVATTSATDNSYTSGGIGFTYWFQSGGWDLYSSRPHIATQPTTTLGYEQVRGGATWLSALNTKASNVVVGDTIRPRFVIENTGLSVTDAYRIEFAPKGVAPSCESVNATEYNEVPPVSSCSGSALCMDSSPNFTNEASTIDLMGGRGTFTSGQIIEDPSNATQNLTLASNTYTEVEYALTVTGDVTDSSYCLRVTDGGTDLDSYTRVAEVQLLFSPNITALSLNGGLDIDLLPGATTTIYATGTVTDLNGYNDIIKATTTVFRNGPLGVGSSCSTNNNNCYRAAIPQCDFVNCAGNSCDVECSFDFYYHADPTDAGTFASDAWTALLEVADTGGSVATATSPSVDLLTLRALSVDSSIDYGTLEVNSDTGSYNATTTFENIGNTGIDVAVEGTDLTDGNSSVIPVNEQIFATSTFTYSACTYCSQLNTSSTNYELDLMKPTSTTPSIIDQVFWGIAVPYGVAGTSHQGDIIFYPISD